VKRSALLRRTELRSKRRKSDVPDWLPGYLMGRDRGCVPHNNLGAPGTCEGRLTIEHVRDRDKPATGMKAPSDKWHTLIACLGANTGWCLTSAAKELEREYLERVETPREDAA
jgi:hypothetical protein